MGRCRLVIEPTNRQQRNKAMKEAKAIEDTLFTIEMSFYKTLFNEEDTRSYNEVYTEYLDKYRRGILSVKRRVRPVFFELNDDYFHWLAKPRVKPEVNPFKAFFSFLTKKEGD